LFRPELDPAPVPTEPWLVDDFELASRLSYFLWSSMPDEALLQTAEAGLLQREQALSDQVQRMIGDPRSAELIANFAGQWLHLRAVPRHQPDRQLFPEFTGELAESMTRSTELFFRNLLDARLPIEELVTSAAVPVNGALAAHYGIAAAADQGFLSLATPAGRGAGVLGHASVLMVTSEPGRTSPVKRGAWVLSNLLCSPPPPPPPGVEGLDEAPAGGESLTVRQRLELHRTDPACAACHRVMDPIGFGLENFDAVGRWRTEDQGQPLDTRGTLPDGTTFSSAEELGRIVANDARFRRCVAQKLATYALGRGIEADRDSALIEAVVSETASGDGSLVAIATALIRSPAFRMRSPEQNGAP